MQSLSQLCRIMQEDRESSVQWLVGGSLMFDVGNKGDLLSSWHSVTAYHIVSFYEQKSLSLNVTAKKVRTSYPFSK